MSDIIGFLDPTPCNNTVLGDLAALAQQTEHPIAPYPVFYTSGQCGNGGISGTNFPQYYFPVNCPSDPSGRAKPSDNCLKIISNTAFDPTKLVEPYFINYLPKEKTCGVSIGYDCTACTEDIINGATFAFDRENSILTMGTTDGKFHVSLDRGQIWESHDVNFSVNGLTYGQGKWVLAGSAKGVGNNGALSYNTSVTNESQWLNDVSLSLGNDVLYIEDLNIFVAVGTPGSESNAIVYSNNGINWTGVSYSTNSRLSTGKKIVYNSENKTIIVIGSGTNTVATSVNGETFKVIANSGISLPDPNDIDTSRSICLCIGGSSKIYRSDDLGETWTNVHTFKDYTSLTNIAVDISNDWVIKTNKDIIYALNDDSGLNWSVAKFTTTTFPNFHLEYVQYSDTSGSFFANVKTRKVSTTGDLGWVLISDFGNNWTNTCYQSNIFEHNLGNPNLLQSWYVPPQYRMIFFEQDPSRVIPHAQYKTGGVLEQPPNTLVVNSCLSKLSLANGDYFLKYKDSGASDIVNECEHNMDPGHRAPYFIIIEEENYTNMIVDMCTSNRTVLVGTTDLQTVWKPQASGCDNFITSLCKFSSIGDTTYDELCSCFSQQTALDTTYGTDQNVPVCCFGKDSSGNINKSCAFNTKAYKTNEMLANCCSFAECEQLGGSASKSGHNGSAICQGSFVDFPTAAKSSSSTNTTEDVETEEQIPFWVWLTFIISLGLLFIYMICLAFI